MTYEVLSACLYLKAMRSHGGHGAGRGLEKPSGGDLHSGSFPKRCAGWVLVMGLYD